jgi:hypothetical protein
VDEHNGFACHKGRRAGGNIILELALVLPFLLLMVAGILDLGLLYWEKHVLTTASREGARAASLADKDGKGRYSPADVMQEVVQKYLDKFHLKDASGNNLTLVMGENFFYTWDASSPRRLTLELRNIPVKMMLLPNIQSLFFGGGLGTDPVILSARTTMAAEWTTPPS